MIVRTDHVAGTAFVAFGCLVFALSGDLPTGRLSLPGAGFMPKLIAGLTIILGATLFLRAGESAPFSTIEWEDGKHAALVIALSSLAVAAYTSLGFITTMVLMILGLLVLVERRNAVHALVYSVVLTILTYGVFVYGLKAPLPDGPFGF